MKHLVLAIAFVTVSCKSEKAPPPPPAPEPVAVAVASAPPPVSPAVVAAPPADCHLRIAIAVDKIAWDGALTGSSAWKAGDKPNLAALEARRGCHAQIASADTVKYQDVITVMDNLVTLGITDIALGGDALPMQAAGSGATPHVSALPDKATLQNAPLIVITKTQVLLKDKVIGKPGDADLQAKLVAALPPKPSDPTAILQADQNTSSITVMRVVNAASQTGYTNLLFAVTSR
jgi:biopolymer transport protein ExbD